MVMRPRGWRELQIILQKLTLAHVRQSRSLKNGNAWPPRRTNVGKMLWIPIYFNPHVSKMSPIAHVCLTSASISVLESIRAVESGIKKWVSRMIPRCNALCWMLRSKHRSWCHAGPLAARFGNSGSSGPPTRPPAPGTELRLRKDKEFRNRRRLYVNVNVRTGQQVMQRSSRAPVLSWYFSHDSASTPYTCIHITVFVIMTKYICQCYKYTYMTVIRKMTNSVTKFGKN